jgi:hypothetical protein
LPEDWVGGWDAHADEQRRARLEATPAQRLAWLEQAIAFAHSVGALPRREEDRAPAETGQEHTDD